MREAWDGVASQWVDWVRKPGHDSYWRFHREAFLPLLPPAGFLTLDLGCGEGRVSRDLARLGHRVISLDASGSLAAAAATHPDVPGPVVVADAAELPFADGTFDTVVAFMMLQDVDRFEAAIAEASRALRHGGHLVAAIVHPINSAGHFTAGDGGQRLPFVIDESWFLRRRNLDRCARDGLAMTFHSEHRPLQAYTEALTEAGLLIERLIEVSDSDPEDAWHHMPLFLDFRAVKRSGALPA